MPTIRVVFGIEDEQVKDDLNAKRYDCVVLPAGDNLFRIVFRDEWEIRELVGFLFREQTVTEYYQGYPAFYVRMSLKDIKQKFDIFGN